MQVHFRENVESVREEIFKREKARQASFLLKIGRREDVCPLNLTLEIIN